MSFPPIPPPGSSYFIAVSYTPETTGCHTICFHLESFTPPLGVPGPPDATYCCVDDIIITPAQVGVPRVVNVDPGTACGGITIVNPLVAGTYMYSGYVYPCCDLSEAQILKTIWPTMPQFVITIGL